MGGGKLGGGAQTNLLKVYEENQWEKSQELNGTYGKESEQLI